MTSLSSHKELYLSNIRIGNDTYAIYAVARGADGAQIAIPEAFNKETLDKIRNLGKALISAHEKNTPALNDIQSINNEGLKTSTATLSHAFSFSSLNHNPFNDELLNDILAGNPSLIKATLTAQDAWNRLNTLFIQEFLKKGSQAKATPAIESRPETIPPPKGSTAKPSESQPEKTPPPEKPRATARHPPLTSWINYHPAALKTSEDTKTLYDNLPLQIRRDLIRHIYLAGIKGTLEDRISELFKNKAPNPNGLYYKEIEKLNKEAGSSQTPGEALLEHCYKGHFVHSEHSAQALADLAALPSKITTNEAESNRLYEYIGQQASSSEEPVDRIEWAKQNYTNPNYRSFVIQAIERYLHSS